MPSALMLLLFFINVVTNYGGVINYFFRTCFERLEFIFLTITATATKLKDFVIM